MFISTSSPRHSGTKDSVFVRTPPPRFPIGELVGDGVFVNSRFSRSRRVSDEKGVGVSAAPVCRVFAALSFVRLQTKAADFGLFC